MAATSVKHAHPVAVFLKQPPGPGVSHGSPFSETDGQFFREPDRVHYCRVGGRWREAMAASEVHASRFFFLRRFICLSSLLSTALLVGYP